MRLGSKRLYLVSHLALCQVSVTHPSVNRHLVWLREEDPGNRAGKWLALVSLSLQSSMFPGSAKHRLP